MALVCSDDEILLEQCEDDHASKKQRQEPPSSGLPSSTAADEQHTLQSVARPLAPGMAPASAAATGPLQEQPDPADFKAKMKQMPVNFEPSSGSVAALRIVCYGDSLTAGFCNRGRSFQPYGRTLSAILEKLALPSSVSVCGLCGKTARQMVEGLRWQTLNDYLDNKGPGLERMLSDCRPDLAIILAGTNDLLRGASPESVLSDVRKLHASCHAAGVPTIALIPPVKKLGSARTMQQRAASLLVEWSKTIPLVVATFDVEKLVPRKPAGLWDSDEVHMAASGQDALGERLGERLACLPMLAQRAGQAGNLARQTHENSDRKRTLTGIFAAKKAVASQQPVGKTGEFPQTSPAMLNLQKRPDDAADAIQLHAGAREGKGRNPMAVHSMPPACPIPKDQPRANTDASRSDAVAPPIEFDTSWACSGFKTGTDVVPVLEKLAERLATHLSKSHAVFDDQVLTLGLNISDDGTWGWSGCHNVSRGSCRLLGDAIFASMESLADRASAALGLDADSRKADTGRWSSVRHIIARLQIHGATRGGR